MGEYTLAVLGVNTPGSWWALVGKHPRFSALSWENSGTFCTLTAGAPGGLARVACVTSMSPAHLRAFWGLFPSLPPSLPQPPRVSLTSNKSLALKSPFSRICVWGNTKCSRCIITRITTYVPEKVGQVVGWVGSFRGGEQMPGWVVGKASAFVLELGPSILILEKRI